jgi:diguanylate cyclase (GGDEF)-like protein/PAS domain S-box-containing protein
MDREMLSRRLVRSGYEVEEAEDGIRALELVTSRPFDLVLLDNMMPGLSGIDVLQRIRETHSASELPVIMVTAQQESENVVAALRLGADDYVTKPVDFAVALARVETRLAGAFAGREMRRETDLYQLASSVSEEGLWAWDLASGRVHYSPRWKSMLGYSEEEIAGGAEEWFGRVHTDDRPRVWAQIQAHLGDQSGSLECEYRMRHRDGGCRWMENRVNVSRDSAGRAIRMAGCQTDITARKTIDPVTGLPNRTWLEEELRAAVEAGTPPAALFLFDLDGFGRIEASLTGEGASRLVAAVAKRLRKLRGAQPEAQRAVAARTAEHQFGVLLYSGALDTAAGLELASRLHAALNEPYILDEETLFATASVGIAMASGEAPGEQLLRDASAALRRAREHGTGRSEVFCQAMHEHDRDGLRLENDLRLAVDRSEFVVYYQPKVDLKSGDIVGFEALARWNRPGFELVMPNDFIPVAEHTGLIVAIGKQVLEQACRGTAELRREFPDVEVSVNVSGRQFSDPRLVETVCGALASAGLPPSALCLEVTETVIIENPESALAMLRRLREMGVRVKLDDFGAGYSSLGYLHRFPFDTLKIDRSFVSRLASSLESAAIVRAIVALARSLNMGVVAEGIETRGQLELLKELGCRHGQGYLFSRPVDFERLRELLRGRRLPQDSAAGVHSAAALHSAQV